MNNKIFRVNIVPKTVQRLQMDDETYFGNGLPDYISNSLMGLINPDQGGSARKFKYGFDDEAKYSAALELGSAVHALILEEDKYNLAEVSKPTGAVGPIFDSVYKMMNRGDESLEFEAALDVAVKYHNYYGGEVKGKRRETLIKTGQPYLDFLTEYKVPGMICLTDDMKCKLVECVKSVNNNKAARELLNPQATGHIVESYNEDVIICEATITESEVDEEGRDTAVDNVYQVSLKSKIDNWSIDSTTKTVTLNDLKTTGSSVGDFAGRVVINLHTIDGEIVEESYFSKGSFQKYHYYRQMYMYGMMLWEYCKEAYGIDDTWTLKVNMIVVETSKPHTSQVFAVGSKWLEIGKREFESLMGRIKWHKQNGFDKIRDIELNSKEFIYEIS